MNFALPTMFVVPPELPVANRPLDYLPPGARAIAEAEARSCRWPLGEVDDIAFRFCGAKRSAGSYCAVHRQASRLEAAR